MFSGSVTRLTVAFCSQEIKKADTARHDTACYDRQGIVVDGSGESHFNRIGIKFWKDAEEGTNGGQLEMNPCKSAFSTRSRGDMLKALHK